MGDRSVILVELSEIIVSQIGTIIIDFWKKKEILKSAWQLKTFVLKYSSRLNRADSYVSGQLFEKTKELKNFEKNLKKVLDKVKQIW